MDEISVGDRWPTEDLVGRIHDGLQNRIDAWIRSRTYNPSFGFGSSDFEPRIPDGTRLTRVDTLRRSYAEISQNTRVVLNDLGGELFVDDSDSLLVDPNSRLGTTGSAVTMPLLRIQRWLQILMPWSFNLVRHPDFLEGMPIESNTNFLEFTHRSNFDIVRLESIEPFSDFWAAVSGRGSWTRRFPRTIRAVDDTGEEGQRARMIVIDDLTAEVYEHRSGSWQVVDDPTARPDTLEDEGLMRRFDYVGPWVFDEISRAMRETRAWEMERLPVDPATVVEVPGGFPSHAVQGSSRVSSSMVEGPIDVDEQQIYDEAVAALVETVFDDAASPVMGGFEILFGGAGASDLSSYSVRRIASSNPQRTQAAMRFGQTNLRIRPGFGGLPLDSCELQVYRATQPGLDFFRQASFSGPQYQPVTLGTTDIPARGASPSGNQPGGSRSFDLLVFFFEFTDF